MILIEFTNFALNLIAEAEKVLIWRNLMELANIQVYTTLWQHLQSKNKFLIDTSSFYAILGLIFLGWNGTLHKYFIVSHNNHPNKVN